MLPQLYLILNAKDIVTDPSRKFYITHPKITSTERQSPDLRPQYETSRDSDPLKIIASSCFYLGALIGIGITRVWINVAWSIWFANNQYHEECLSFDEDFKLYDQILFFGAFLGAMVMLHKNYLTTLALNGDKAINGVINDSAKHPKDRQITVLKTMELLSDSATNGVYKGLKFFAIFYAPLIVILTLTHEICADLSNSKLNESGYAR